MANPDGDATDSIGTVVMLPIPELYRMLKLRLWAVLQQ